MPSGEETRMPLATLGGDRKQVLDLYRKIRRSRAKLVGPDGRTDSLPVSICEFLVKLTADLCEGQSVAIIQNDATLENLKAMTDATIEYGVYRSPSAPSPNRCGRAATATT